MTDEVTEVTIEEFQPENPDHAKLIPAEDFVHDEPDYAKVQTPKGLPWT